MAFTHTGQTAQAIYAAALFNERLPDSANTMHDLMAKNMVYAGVIWHIPPARELGSEAAGDYLTPNGLKRLHASPTAKNSVAIADLQGDLVSAYRDLRRNAEANPQVFENAEFVMTHLNEGRPAFISPQPGPNGQPGKPHGVFTYFTNNIGDDIQTLAAMRFIPASSPLTFVNREMPQAASADLPVPLIMNGWYAHLDPADADQHWPPDDSIEPLLAAMHITPRAAAEVL